jgi:hypothetical protein
MVAPAVAPAIRHTIEGWTIGCCTSTMGRVADEIPRLHDEEDERANDPTRVGAPSANLLRAMADPDRDDWHDAVAEAKPPVVEESGVTLTRRDEVPSRYVPLRKKSDRRLAIELALGTFVVLGCVGPMLYWLFAW